ncbi:MAG: hypothetical protein J6Y03_06010 [Alphaproteobacteria bacterium]|nr:hypothetical protein [Alphaproteobacteria bacterium]
MKKILLWAVAFSVLAFSAKADMFTLHVKQTSTSIDETRSFKSVLDLFDKYEDGSLDSIISGYDKTADATGSIDFRGIPMTLDFVWDGSKFNLNFNVQKANISETFSGVTQEEAFKQLKDYLKKNKDDLMKKILKSSVKDTPYDLVAGSPTSMMATMTDASFQRAGGGVLGNFVSYLSPNGARHHFKFNNEDKTADIISLPLAKTFKFGESGWALMFDMPLTYADFDGSKSFAGQLGLGLKVPLVQAEHFKWDIIPGGRVGAIGSKDMISGGLLYSGTITNNMQVPMGPVTVSMTNMAGYIRDFSVKVADYEVDYDLENWVYKNGAQLRWDISDDWAINTAYSYTFYTGSNLFIDKYHDVGASLIYKFDEGSFFSGVGLTGNYTFDGDDYYAYRAGIDILF